MRVALLTSAYPPAIGGAETYAQLLAEGLAAKSHDVRVVTDGSYGSTGRTESRGVDVVRLPGWRDRVRDVSLVAWEEAMFGVLPELVAALSGQEWDVIHANSFETAVLARMLAGPTNTPVVATYHEMVPLDGILTTGRSRFAYGQGLFDLLIAGSAHYRDRAYLAGAPEEAVRLVPHGVPDTRAAALRDRTRRELGYLPEHQVVLVPGRFKERKGQLDLLEAFRTVHRELPRARALFVGSVHSASGEYLARMKEEIASADLEEAVQVRTDVVLDRMPGVYAAGDLVVVPSHEEGLGLVVLEAMAAGRPVLSTRVSGVTEIMDGDNGILVPPRDPGALAGGALALLRDSGLASRVAGAGRRTYLRKYTLDRMIDQTVKVYEELAGPAEPAAVAPPPAPRTAPKRAVSRRRVHRTPWMRVHEDVIVDAAGARSGFTVVSRGDFVVALPVTRQGDVVLVRQYRYAARQWQLELPQGGLEPGESASEAALRELREETGFLGEVAGETTTPFYEAADWAEQHFTVVHIAARDRDVPETESSEAGMETVVMSYQDVMRAARREEITDPPTLAALYLGHLGRDEKGVPSL
ncbi:glycosyltransferase [Streptomyces sp. NPDC050433]|uniref:glycosyltransferase n=1 Tax=unclassified Streptomyces TaxID=2593676 RepID=UPI00342366A1